MTQPGLSNIRTKSKLIRDAERKLQELDEHAQPWRDQRSADQNEMLRLAARLVLEGVDIEDVIEATDMFGKPPYEYAARQFFAGRAGDALRELIVR